MTRKINKAWKSKPTIEGAGVRLKRAFGYYQVSDLDPTHSCSLTTSTLLTPAIILPAFPGIPTAASKLLLICFKVQWSMGTVWETKASFRPETCNG
jgi:hypothetical protein